MQDQELQHLWVVKTSLLLCRHQDSLFNSRKKKKANAFQSPDCQSHNATGKKSTWILIVWNKTGCRVADLGRVALFSRHSKLKHHAISLIRPSSLLLSEQRPRTRSAKSPKNHAFWSRAHGSFSSSTWCLGEEKRKRKILHFLNKSSQDSSLLWVAINAFSCSVACQTH